MAQTCCRLGNGGGMVNFLHNHYRVLHVAVHKMNPEVGDFFCQPPSAFERAPYLPTRLGERYPVEPGV